MRGTATKERKLSLSGINIQWPISELIVSGKKIIETRTYPMPEKFIGQDLALIETPGKKGKFKARIIAIVRFDKSFQYQTEKEFYADSERHCVTRNSEWKWVPGKEKWGWPVLKVVPLTEPIPPPNKRGIVFASGCIIFC